MLWPSGFRMMQKDEKPLLVVIGVAGSGKTTLASRLAERLGVPFVEGDSLHPAANVKKMASGIPLTDEDRWPWLEAIGERMEEERSTGHGVVVACSALKRAYRDCLRSEVHGKIAFHAAGRLAPVDQRTDEEAQRPFHAACAAGQPVRHARKVPRPTNMR